MQYAQCKCGKAQMWDSGYAIHDCQGCDDCGTTLARGPSQHRELKGHTPKPQYNQNTGELSHYVCSVCYARCDENGKEVKRNSDN